MRKSSGIIIFRGSTISSMEYLLLQSPKSKCWAPPKGHISAGETILEAAKREVREETGLESSDYELVTNEWSTEVRYKPSSEQVHGKSVVFFLARLTNHAKPIHLSNEHLDYRWMKMESACQSVKHQETRDALEGAQVELIKSGRYEHESLMK